MSKADEEQRKLFANLLNNMANGCFVVGIAAPLATVLYKPNGEQHISESAFEIGVCFWVVAVIALHGVAQWMIGGLEDE